MDRYLELASKWKKSLGCMIYDSMCIAQLCLSINDVAIGTMCYAQRMAIAREA